VAAQPQQPGGGVGVGAIVSTNSGPDPFTGLSINNRVGANTFYAAGYTGTRSRVANVEGGHVWSGHETLGHVNTFIHSPGSYAFNNGVNAAMDRHATWVAHAIGGRTTPNPPVPGGEYQRGIAPGATLWSGSIASNWVGAPFTLSFNWSSYGTFIGPYHTAMIGGVGGQTADVINSSWGFTGDSAGRDASTMGIDALVRASGKVAVFCAGNSGSGANTVWAPATAYNVISVGALASDTSNPTYNTPSGFSSRGPNFAFLPNVATGFGTGNGTLVGNARVRVDIAAPGQNLTLAFYGGTTGGNTGGTPSGAPDWYTFNTQGTSFAAPTVAGGAALMVDVGRALGLPNSADGRVVKAVLMNSADKTQGWNNGQTATGIGVVTTTQALDFAVGAGRMNLARAYNYYADTNSTRDVPGTSPDILAPVQRTGWDFGTVRRTSANFYTVNAFMPEGSTFTATLTWFVNRSINLSTLNFNTLADSALANLELEIWRVVDGGFGMLLGRSISQFNNSEHLHFTVPPGQEGQYGIIVRYETDNWNFAGTTTEAYALAWEFTPVPEPAGLLAVAGVALVGWAVRRRLRPTTC
jgi:hypothetical protein